MNFYIEFVKRYGVGIHLNLNEDIQQHLTRVRGIVIEEEILTKNKFNMVSRGEELERFHQIVMEGTKN